MYEKRTLPTGATSFVTTFRNARGFLRSGFHAVLYSPLRDSDGLRQVKQCGLLFYAIHLRPCAEPHRAEAECIGAKRHILRGNGAVDDPIVFRGWECTLEIAADQNGGRSLFQRLCRSTVRLRHFKQLFAVGDDDERPIARIHAARTAHAGL